jgi:hypothetical protein
MAKLTVYLNGDSVDFNLSNDVLRHLFEEASIGFQSGAPGFWIGHTEDDGSGSALWVPASIPVSFGFDGPVPSLSGDGGEPAGTGPVQ